MHVDIVLKICYNLQLYSYKAEYSKGKYRCGNLVKEYEYIVLATNEIFSHMISSVICLENYYNQNIDNSFRNIFRFFNELREDYKVHIASEVDVDGERMQLAKFRTRCRYKREEILTSFIEELKELDNSINYDDKVREYYDRIQKEDVETLEMQLMIYPYLMSLVRKNEEGKAN